MLKVLLQRLRNNVVYNLRKCYYNRGFNFQILWAAAFKPFSQQVMMPLKNTDFYPISCRCSLEFLGGYYGCTIYILYLLLKMSINIVCVKESWQRSPCWSQLLTRPCKHRRVHATISTNFFCKYSISCVLRLNFYELHRVFIL